MGSPLVWWASLAALGYLGVTIVRGRRPNDAAVVIVTGFAMLYLPLVALNFKRSFTFIYYLLPAVPFMCLAIGAVAAQWAHSFAPRVILATFVVAALLLFAFFYPVLTAMPVSKSQKEAREWFRDCQPPPDSPAPTGWCWQ
jgi:dolichyl-phosphate-mannose--protein O-mannosyl transferase